jgi:hypothetical protein
MRKALTWTCVVWNGGWLLIGSIGIFWTIVFGKPTSSAAAANEVGFLLPLIAMFVAGPALNIAAALFGAGLADRKANERTAAAFD